MGRRLSLLAAISLLAFAAPALAGKGDPKHAFTPAGQKLAKSIGLTLADLPAGFKATPTSPDNGGPPKCKGYDPDQSDLSIVGESTSPDFNGPSSLPYIASAVNVFVSVAQGKTAYSRVVRQEVASCLAGLFAKSAPKGSKFTVGAATLKRLSGYGDQAASVRLLATITEGKQRIPFVVEVFFLNKGAVDVSMIAVNLVVPYPGAPALLAKLAGRLP